MGERKNVLFWSGQSDKYYVVFVFFPSKEAWRSIDEGNTYKYMYMK